MEQTPSTELAENDAWVRVTGGGLDIPVLVRVAYGRDGRPMMTGLIIGNDGPAEITADTLRHIRIGALLEQLTAGFSPHDPPLVDDLRAQTEWGLMHEFTRRSPPPAPEQTRSRGPSDAELRHFAEVYRTEVRRNRRRAMSATAEEVGVSRATANRWAAQCRKYGYLDRKDGG
jgi:hypothetical protein